MLLSRTTLITTGLGDKERLLGKMSSAINSQGLIGKKTWKEYSVWVEGKIGAKANDLKLHNRFKKLQILQNEQN